MNLGATKETGAKESIGTSMGGSNNKLTKTAR
jgi:hypothetical protein